jgi:competence protein ComEA
MKMISRVQETFGFTRNELKVILFLAVSLAAGAGIRWAVASRQPAYGAAFDYAAMDREFADGSRRSPAATTEHPAPRQLSTTAAAVIVNLNTASQAELMRLPGIGEKYAERILRYRSEHGPFTSVADLDAVKGIGKKTIERLRPLVRVR